MPMVCVLSHNKSEMSCSELYSILTSKRVCTGISEPRAARDGSPLPSVRKVSTVIYEAVTDRLSEVHTVLHMTFGQMLDHDTDRTPISKFLKSDGK